MKRCFGIDTGWWGNLTFLYSLRSRFVLVVLAGVLAIARVCVRPEVSGLTVILAALVLRLFVKVEIVH